jgi:PhnB protein
MTTVQPYLVFDGACEEALDFYRRKLGAKVNMLMRIKEAPPGEGPAKPGTENKIMHVAFTVGGTTLLASDGHCLGKPNFQGFALSLNVASAAEADRVFNALADGGEVRMPITATFFSPRFGMVADKFGLTWMVVVPRETPP